MSDDMSIHTTMPTPALVDVERFAQDERSISEQVESLMAEHNADPWGIPDFSDKLRRILLDQRRTAERLVGSDGHLDLSLVFPPSESDIAARLTQAMSSGHGLVVVAGRVVSGRTTTLTAIARHLLSEGRAVGNLADTFEVLARRYPAQILTANYPQHDALFPRFFKDAITADEILTNETAIEALRASRANTVLATLHSPSAVEVPRHLASLAGAKILEEYNARIARDLVGSEALDQYRERFRQAQAKQDALEKHVGPLSPGWGIRWFDLPDPTPPLRLFVVYQHLVRRLCASCSPDGEPRGCDECRHGYSGYAALADTLEVEAHNLADLLVEDCSPHEAYQPFAEHAAALVAHKVTTQDEIRRVLGS